MSRIADLAAAATPGPWVRQGSLIHGPDKGGIDIGYLLAETYGAWPHHTAAYIAAASPDVVLAMDRVCEAARLVSQWHDSIGSGPIEELDAELGELHDLCAALAKLTGDES